MVAGSMSLAGAAVHLATIAGGPDWYRFFGAGEPLARAAERGSPIPALITTAIAVLLLLWAAYAFSAAGLVQRLPLLRTGLVVISLIYLARGLFLFAPAAFGRPDLSPAFIFWSSLIVLVMGLTHAAGTALAWPTLSERGAGTTSAKPESL
jgi:hypothetical protein